MVALRFIFSVRRELRPLDKNGYCSLRQLWEGWLSAAMLSGQLALRPRSLCHLFLYSVSTTFLFWHFYFIKALRKLVSRALMLLADICLKLKYYLAFLKTFYAIILYKLKKSFYKSLST
jgi:hypothetical protein